jgi:ubiquitin-protein ligase
VNKQNKNKKIDDAVEVPEDLPFAPPEMHYLSTRYIVHIPVTDGHLKDRWDLRVYAVKLVERKLGDEAQVTAMKVRQPHLISKTKAKIRNEVPQARLLLTVKF